MRQKRARRSPAGRSGKALRRIAAPTNQTEPSVLLQRRAGLVQRALDERAMLLGTDLATENAARREDDHRRSVFAQLCERLVVEMLSVAATLLADAVGLGLGLRFDVGGCRLGRLGGPLRDRGGLAARLREELLDLMLHPLALLLRGFGEIEPFADAARAIVEGARDRAPEEATQEPVEDEELDEGYEDPVRIHGQREGCLLGQRAREHPLSADPRPQEDAEHEGQDAESLGERGSQDHVGADRRSGVGVAPDGLGRHPGEDADADAGPDDAEADRDASADGCFHSFSPVSFFDQVARAGSECISGDGTRSVSEWDPSSCSSSCDSIARMKYISTSSAKTRPCTSPMKTSSSTNPNTAASPGRKRSPLMTTSMISPPNTLPQRRSVSVSIRKISLKSSMKPTSTKIGPMKGPSLKPEKLNQRFG